MPERRGTLGEAAAMIYLLFAGDNFYPGSGLSNLVATFRAEHDEAAKARMASDVERLCRDPDEAPDWASLYELDVHSLVHRLVADVEVERPREV